jgi:hypothetical protein
VLDLNPDIVRFIIERAREFHGKEGVVIPEDADNLSDDWALQVLSSHSGDLTLRELMGAIRDLEPDQQVQLVALMWLGRGDFEADEWGQALQQARDNWNPRSAEYLTATPLVADYLEEGLSLLGYTNDG